MVWDLATPTNITYFWNIGATLGICIMSQILSGWFLSFHYNPHVSERFESVISIIENIWMGWLIRFIHLNGASLFFLLVYFHIGRGLYYFRPVHKEVWIRGTTILILLISISFLGYVLPWGQISYWAVTVISNLFSVVPFIGESLVYWMWGGFAVDTPTLQRFYSLHFILPMILMIIVLIHLIFLHKQGSRNRLGTRRNLDKVNFHPYFLIKDLWRIIIIMFLFLIVTSTYPDALLDSVNYAPANPMSTPHLIQPEWYFLPYYAVLRSFSRKALGVLTLGFSVLIFYTLTLFKIKFSSKFFFLRTLNFWFVIRRFLFLIKIGCLPAEQPYIDLRFIGTSLYFSLLFILFF